VSDFIFYAIIGVLGAALLLVIFWPELKKKFGAKVPPRISAELDREHFDLSDWWNNQADPMLKKLELRVEQLIVRANSVIATNLAAAASTAGAVPPSAAPTPVVGPAAPAVVAETIAAPSVVGETLSAEKSAQQEKSMPVEDKGVVSAGQLLSGWVLANWETNTEPVPAKRHADLMYLAQMARKPGGNMVFEDVVIGNQGEINVCKNYSHTNGWDAQVVYNYDGSYKDWGAEADKAVRVAAQASVAAYLASHPSFSRTYDFSVRRRP
jgi:hypothetical protein